MGADFGNVSDHDNGSPEHHFSRGEVPAVFPQAFLQNAVEDLRLPNQLRLHIFGSKTVFDFQNPSSLVHLPPDCDHIGDEAFPHKENAFEIPRDSRI